MSVAVCDFCGKPVDVNSKLTWTAVTGYDRPGKAGGSDVVMRQRVARFVHPGCMELARNGVSVHQQTLEGDA